MPTYLEIIASEQFDQVRAIFENNKPRKFYEGNERAEYDVRSHPVMINDDRNRPDKKIYKPEINPVTGEPIIDTTTGKPRSVAGTSKVNRVPASFQEIIVNRRTSFLLGNPIKYNCIQDDKDVKQKAVVDYVYEIEDLAKTIYKNKELARRKMSELQCAELWYLVDVSEIGLWNSIAKRIGIKKPQYQLKMKVLSPWQGDTLYPLYDVSGDMIAFARSYKIKENDSEIEHFDVYTADMTYKYVNRVGWKLDDTSTNGGRIPNLSKKIPIIYYTQDKPEWANVQKMIERLEKLLSNHGDMNDYFGEPILAIFGQLIQAINKGESGKIMQLSENAKASFLALDSPPESIKMEIENLEKFIWGLSQTPNISFSEMKAMGNDVSGYAIELLFLDAHLAAISHEETFGIGIQRRVNLLKAFVGNVLDISLAEASQAVRMNPVFTPYMPKNKKEFIDMLTSAVTNGVLSNETATEKMEDEGFIADASIEIERLSKEAKEKASRDNMIGLNAFGQ